MKELSVEQKAHRYDEAKYIMKEYLESGNAGVIAENTIKKAFPELSESDDERVRKKLLEYFKSFTSETFFNGVPTSDAIAWLEKQGENVHNEELSKLLNEVICHFINNPDIPYSKRDEVSKKIIPYVEKLEKQGKKPDDTDNKFIRMRETKPKDISEFLDRLTTVEQEFLWEHIAKIRELDKEEQKPADNIEKPWNEYDNKHFERILKELKNQWQRPSNRPYLDDIVSDYYWLKSLKDRVQPQPKQEWSEEDDSCIRYLIECLEVCAKGTSLKMVTSTAQKYVEWLKSIKGKYTWKPSDEQIEAIKDAIEFLGCTKKVREDLKSLYEQMKKLREE